MEAYKKSMQIIALWGVQESKTFVDYIIKCSCSPDRKQFWQNVQEIVSAFNPLIDEFQ